MRTTKKVNKFHPNPKAKLMDQTKEVLRYHHYANRTELSYCRWILRYLHYHGGKTHPREMGRQQVEVFYQTWSVKEMYLHPHSAKL